MTNQSALKINIHEAKTHLSRFVNKVEQGQAVILCRHGSPVAQIIPFPSSKKLRPLGLAKGMGKIKKSFFDPLTEEDFLSGNI